MTDRATLVRAAAAVAVVLAGATFATPPAASGSTSPPALAARVLDISELPPNWHVDHSAPTARGLDTSTCLAGLTSPAGRAPRHTTVTFVQGASLPELTESLATGAQPSALYATAVGALDRCRSLTFDAGTTAVRATIRGLGLARVGSASTAYRMTMRIAGFPLSGDLVLFRVRSFVGEIVYLDVGSPIAATVTAFAREAASKAAGAAVSPPAIVSIASAPVRTAHTASGAVGYREIGTGPPLVMVMGFAGTMETWDPRFVDVLAEHHEVVVFDNAGIGRTAAVRGRLSVDAMAEQTSALVRTLGLHRPAVLGWSMGSMIAQALAVLHRAQVSRLVLCAAYPGTRTVEPSQQAIAALTGSNAAQALADLFPPGSGTAGTQYEVSIGSYPKSRPAPAAVIRAQRSAVLGWWHGTDRAGRRTPSITAPTLVADGSQDRLDAAANDRRVASLIPGSQLHIYRGAGHAFLFEDATTVAADVESFLAGRRRS